MQPDGESQSKLVTIQSRRSKCRSCVHGVITAVHKKVPVLRNVVPFQDAFSISGFPRYFTSVNFFEAQVCRALPSSCSISVFEPFFQHATTDIKTYLHMRYTALRPDLYTITLFRLFRLFCDMWQLDVWKVRLNLYMVVELFRLFTLFFGDSRTKVRLPFLLEGSGMATWQVV